jgi:hypothetical protein
MVPSRRRARRLLRAFLAISACVSPAWGPAVSSAAVANHFSLALRTPANISDIGRTAERNAYVTLQAWETRRAIELKQANPQLKVLVYQNLSAMAKGRSTGGLSSTGVNYDEAVENHQDWFLTDTTGAPISEAGYSWLWMADIGNPGYQQRWGANVLSLLKDGPWDGVMIDDANTTTKYHVHPPTQISEYAGDSAYQAAVKSMLEYVGPRIIASGHLAIPNMGAWSENPEVVEEWLPYVSGGMDEMFVKWSSTPGVGYRGAPEWHTQLHELETTQHLGKIFLAITQAAPNDIQGQRYGWATVLLGADGLASFLATQSYDGSEAWSSDFESQLGEPLAPATRLANGTWARQFTNGLVIVNPTESSAAVNFGATYSGSGLTDAGNGILEPHTADILIGGAGAEGLRHPPTAEGVEEQTPAPAAASRTVRVGSPVPSIGPGARSDARHHRLRARCRRVSRKHRHHVSRRLRRRCRSVHRAGSRSR